MTMAKALRAGVLFGALACGACRGASTAAPAEQTGTPQARTPRVTFDGNIDLTTDELEALVRIDKPGGLSDADPLGGALAVAAHDSLADREGSPRSARAADKLLGERGRGVLVRDVLRVTERYYDRGYLAAKVDEPRVTLSSDGRFVDIAIHVDEGPRFRVGTLTVVERDARGVVVEALGGNAALRARITLAEGDWFSRRVFERDRASIRATYADAGYAGVTIDDGLELDPARATVTLAVEIRRNVR
jgi:hypothetical protein